MRRVKIGMVGAGFMGQLAHLANFVQMESCEVVALAEVRPELGRRVAERHRIPRLYRSHLELAQDPEVEAVVSMQWDHLHAPIAIDLMEAGKHVLIEKPMAASVEDGQRMNEAAQRNGVILMLAYTRRYDPGVLMAKQAFDRLRGGEMGDLYLARTWYLGGDWIANLGGHVVTDEPQPPFEKRFPSWLPPELEDVFMFVNNSLTHNIDLMRFLLGEPKEVVYADLRRGRQGLTFVLDFGEVRATFEGAWTETADWKEGVELHCGRGWMRIDLPANLLRNVPATVTYYSGGKTGAVVQPKAEMRWAFAEEDAHFIECVREGKQPRTPGTDAIRNVEIAEAVVRRSMESLAQV